MNNERKINKSFSNFFKNINLDKSNNSEDFEFLSIKDNIENKSEKIVKKNKSDLYIKPKDINNNNENLKTNIILNEDNKSDFGFQEIKNEDINNKEQKENLEDKQIFEINKKAKSETVNKIEEEKQEIIENKENKSNYELDDLIVNENIENKNESFRKVKEENVSKEEDEKISEI